MAIYRVIEAGAVVNRIEWDGVTPYDPGAGRSLEIEPAPEPELAPEPAPAPDAA